MKPIYLKDIVLELNDMRDELASEFVKKNLCLIDRSFEDIAQELIFNNLDIDNPKEIDDFLIIKIPQIVDDLYEDCVECIDDNNFTREITDIVLQTKDELREYNTFVSNLQEFYWLQLVPINNINYLRYLTFEKYGFNRISFIFTIVKFMDIKIDELEIISKNFRLTFELDPFEKEDKIKSQINDIFNSLDDYKKVFKLNKSKELSEIERFKLFFDNRVILYLKNNNIYAGSRELNIDSGLVGSSSERKMLTRSLEKFEKMKQIDLNILRKFI